MPVVATEMCRGVVRPIYDVEAMGIDCYDKD